MVNTLIGESAKGDRVGGPKNVVADDNLGARGSEIEPDDDVALGSASPCTDLGSRRFARRRRPSGSPRGLW